MEAHPSVWGCRHIGSVRRTSVWQDCKHPRNVFFLTHDGLDVGWIVHWGRAHDTIPPYEMCDWLATLTPADTCDLYAMVEAAIANPPEDPT